MRRPTGVMVIVAICFLGAGYFLASGLAVLARIPMSRTPMQRALEFREPYLSLGAAAFWVLLGWGLLRLRNWARWAVMLAAVCGIAALLAQVLVVPTHFGWSLLSYGLQVVVRMAVVWYLFRVPVASQFSKSVGAA